ncbi:hypothetical protein ACKKBG_A06970 [Auxenochlorella protothecoides x Auxenochlorella symbiontica]
MGLRTTPQARCHALTLLVLTAAGVYATGLLMLRPRGRACPSTGPPHQALGPELVVMSEEGIARVMAGPRVPQPLEPLLAAFAHNISLPSAFLARGVVSAGSHAAAARALSPLLAGRPLSVGVLGGSLTFGRGATTRGKTDWAPLVFDWVRRAFPGTQHELRNGAIPAAPSEWASFCMHEHLPPAPDVVLVEYIINDMTVPWEHAHRRSYERLLRRLLQLPTRPLVVPVMLFNYHPHQHKGVFHHTPENDVGTLSLYYDLPWLSMRGMLYHPIKTGAVKKSDVMMGDSLHLINKGHRAVADLVIHFLRMEAARAALGRQHVTLGGDDGALPAPMLPNLVELPAEYCAQGERFRRDVARNATGGFWWKGKGDEMRAVTQNPNATLDIHVDASVTAPGSNRTAVLLFTAKSHDKIGNAEASCISGCSCDPIPLNGTIPHLFATQEHLDLLLVTPSPECVLRVRTTGRTDSNGREVRVRGVVVSAAAGLHVPEEFYWGEEMQYGPSTAPPVYG